jgi:UPF0716 protein FxsA
MPLLLFAIFVVVPIAEIAVIVTIGHVIGWGLTVLLLFVSALVGSALLRREGRRAWYAFTDALASGRPPAREVADGGLVLFGSALMIAPGFLTDALGVLCLLPPTRALLRRAVTSLVGRRLLAKVGVRRVRSRRGPGRPYDTGSAGTDRYSNTGSYGDGAGGRVIDGEVRH